MHRMNSIQEKTTGTMLSQVKRNISQQFINNYMIQLHYKHLQKHTVFIYQQSSQSTEELHQKDNKRKNQCYQHESIKYTIQHKINI